MSLSAVVNVIDGTVHNTSQPPAIIPPGKQFTPVTDLYITDGRNYSHLASLVPEQIAAVAASVPGVITVVSADYAATRTDGTIIIIPGVALTPYLLTPITVTLYPPTLADRGRSLIISRRHRLEQLASIDTGVPGPYGIYHLQPYEAAAFQTDGVNWYLLSRGKSDEFADNGVTSLPTGAYGSYGITAIDLPAGATASGVVRWGVEITDGTDFQSASGVTTFAMINKATVFSSDINTVASSNVTTGGSTLSVVFSVAAALPRTQVYAVPTTSLTPTISQMRFHVDIFAYTAASLRYDAA